MHDERLLSAREAALELGVVPRTAQLRARRAQRAGDLAVQTIAGAYVVPDWWWQNALAEASKLSQPRKKDLSAQRVPVEGWY